MLQGALHGLFHSTTKPGTISLGHGPAPDDFRDAAPLAP